MDDMDFIECDTCKAKLGMPVLCGGCLNNRAVIEKFKKEKAWREENDNYGRTGYTGTKHG